MSDSYVSPDQALQRFGLSSFRPGQREVIEAIASGNDCLCVMPTGGGKSLCYQLPSLIRPGLTIVVSPLIALMKDQVDSLGRHGIPAALINSTLSQSEQQTRLQDVAAGKYQLVYVAPERLRNPRFQEAIRATPIQLLAIDEAHCISQWGHDFRPDYTRIGKFREWLGGVQTVALTATATARVRQDIMDVLGLNKAKQFMSGFARPNLHFGVVPCQTERDKDEQLEKFLRHTNGAGIIYAATRKRCEALVEWIGSKLKMPVGAYHAGLMADQRRSIQERFMNNDLRVIVATNAFGMGIDKSDLRFVIHYNMPGSLEAYYQEAGRAGRDGKQSVCVLLYSFQDRYIQEFFIDNNYPPKEMIQGVYEFLCKIEDDPIEMTLEEIRDRMGLSTSPEAIGSCLQILARTHVLERMEMGGGLAVVRINSDLPTLVDLLPREAKVRRSILRLLEKAVGDRRFEEVSIHPRWMLQQSGMEREALSRTLREVCKLDEVDYIPPFRGRAIHFRRRGVSFEELQIDFENLRRRKDAEYDRLNQVVNFAQSPLCRQTTILNYFGDNNAENCKQCDRCQRKPGWPQLDLNAETPESEERAPSSNSELVDDHSVEASSTPAPTAGKGLLSSEQQTEFLNMIVDAISRIHGRLGKHLLAQYLCGSNNAKVQKLNLHRLSGFGVLKNFRQADGVALIDLLMTAGLLRQQEVNRNRPTLSVAPELMDARVRAELLASVEIPLKLASKILPLIPRTTTNATTSSTSKGTPPAERIPAAESTRVDLARTAPTAAPPHATTGIGAPASAAPDSGHAVGGSEASAFPRSRSPEAQSDRSAGVTPSLFPEQDPTIPPSDPPDWYWTVELFRAGNPWLSVQAMRRMTDEELAASLCEAVRNGAKLERPWLAPFRDDLRSIGQQRVVRELQRRAAAGVK